jgi:hypothetical protein
VRSPPNPTTMVVDVGGHDCARCFVASRRTHTDQRAGAVAELHCGVGDGIAPRHRRTNPRSGHGQVRRRADFAAELGVCTTCGRFLQCKTGRRSGETIAHERHVRPRRCRQRPRTRPAAGPCCCAGRGRHVASDASRPTRGPHVRRGWVYELNRKPRRFVPRSFVAG